MNHNEKKKLAECIGWKFTEYGNGYIECKEINFDNWNPDTDHKQFAEVWNKLTQSQKLKALGYCVDPECKYPVVELLHVLTVTYKMLNNLPAVMDAVLELLGIKEGQP